MARLLRHRQTKGAVTARPNLTPPRHISTLPVSWADPEVMLERQREGIAKAKAAGKYKGRQPVALDGRREVVRLAAEGLTKTLIARRLNLGEATVYRILADARRQTDGA